MSLSIPSLSTGRSGYRLPGGPSLSALLAVVGAGLAVSAQLQSIAPPELRLLGQAEGMPELPLASIMLLRSERNRSQASETLAEHIIEGFRL